MTASKVTMRRCLGLSVGALAFGCDDPPQGLFVPNDRCPAQTQAAQSVATIATNPAIPPPAPPTLAEQCYGALALSGESIWLPDTAAARLARAFWNTDASTLQAALGEVPIDPVERVPYAGQASLASQASAGYRSWASSWLGLTTPVDGAAVDAGVAGDASADLGADAGVTTSADATTLSLQEGLLRFIEDVVIRDGSINTLLTQDLLFMDENVAQFYGLNWSILQPDDPWLLTEMGPYYVGILTQGWMPRAHTTPAARGRFVLEKLLGTPPPTFPHDATLTVPEPLPGQTRREAWEGVIQTEPACNACHLIVDNPGFTFSHYDSLGQYQETESGTPIDSSAEIHSGSGASVMIADSNEYALLLAKDPRVTKTLARSLFDHIELTETLAGIPEHVQICHEAIDIWVDLIWLSATPEPQPVRDLFIQIATRNWLGQPFGPPPSNLPSMPSSPTPTAMQPPVAVPPSGGTDVIPSSGGNTDCP